ncbi:Isochorismatase-like protein [Amanita rubescens]|nr:Isochorismatase-like protein [Amanita rubescens]
MPPIIDAKSTLFFLCDIQTKFKPAIYGYHHVVATANKMLKLAKILSCEVLCTTQNAKALGPIDPDIDLSSLGPLLIGSYDKTLFSMLTLEVETILKARPHVTSIVIFGIESHVCVLQTVLSLASLPTPYAVYVIADGVSSCNQFEVPIALARMRNGGATITTSESIAFQLVKDASIPEFKAFSRMIKEEKESTKRVGEALLAEKTAWSGVGLGESENRSPLRSAM